MNRASVPRLRRTLIVLGTALATVAATLTVATTAPVAAAPSSPDDYSGSDLWLRYVPVDDAKLLQDYRRAATAIVVENADATKVHRHTTDLAMAPGSGEKLVETTLGAARDELVRGLGGLLGQPTPVTTADAGTVPDGAVVVGTPTSSPLIGRTIAARDLAKVGDEGFLVRSVSRGRARFTVIAGNSDLGALYGTFAFLRSCRPRNRSTTSASPSHRRSSIGC